ncbi:PREDICTED: protein yippee-like At4g27745 [Theobroma cacao]|uniref:Protein yippee-like n=1 Tax=Theobroma cacao TaxID=3641 RepID=A0AB32VQA7_THECC|nr:PREDICTED: protein yippee-like At4g27745 [Theobroma cacao]
MADWMIGPRLYNCYKCGNMICRHDDSISKIFQASHGRAFLFTHVQNVVDGPEEDRQLMTGLQTVTDVYCSDCGELLGWRYIKAYEELQKYKEGKIVLERLKIAKESW